MFRFESASRRLYPGTLEHTACFSVPTSEDLKSIKNSLGGDLQWVPILKRPNPNAKCAPQCCAPGASLPPRKLRCLYYKLVSCTTLKSVERIQWVLWFGATLGPGSPTFRLGLHIPENVIDQMNNVLFQN